MRIPLRREAGGTKGEVMQKHVVGVPGAALIGTGLLLWPRASEACGTCVAALVDRVLPLSHLWSLLAVVWFLAGALVARITHRKLPGLPSPVGAFVCVAVFGVLGVIAVGPLLVLLLFVPAVMALVYAWKAGREPGWRPCRMMGSLGLIATLGLGGYSYLLYSRTPADYILQWEATGPARLALKALQEQEPDSLPVYRQLVVAGGARTTAHAAERLGASGVPETDVPLLLTALQRMEGLRGSADEVQQVEAALQRLSGLSLPPGSPAAVWRARWQQRHQGR